MIVLLSLRGTANRWQDGNVVGISKGVGVISVWEARSIGPTKGCKAIKVENRGDTAHIHNCNEAWDHVRFPILRYHIVWIAFNKEYRCLARYSPSISYSYLDLCVDRPTTQITEKYSTSMC